MTVSRPGRANRTPPLPPRAGTVRRSQLVSTYGVGSMIALEERSFVVGGLDDWRVRSEPDLIEVRLQSRLGVHGFVRPPSPELFGGASVPVRLFPELYTCPGDHENNLREYRKFNSPRGRNVCRSCENGLTPSRFVVACKNGHLDEFPYWQWAHAGRMVDDPRRCALSYRTTGRSSALRSIVINCSCGAEASMEGAFGRGALVSVGYTCRGGRPWLDNGREQGCDADCRTLQRGSSAAWFPVVRSALSIPPFSMKLYDAVGQKFAMWKDESDETIVRQATNVGLIGGRAEYTAENVLEAMNKLRRHIEGGAPDPSVVTGFEPADVIRHEEYQQLGASKYDDHFVCGPPPDGGSEPLPSRISQVMLVSRLREVRVLQTFTRVEAPLESDPKERFAALSGVDTGWLPGIEVSGEGVFLRVDGDLLRDWENDPGSGAEDRARRIREQHEEALRQRVVGRQVPESPVRARLVLLHSLAHMLINEWSLDSGYPASALRERLYVADDMAGILIYTASSDSAGSLGGLVEQGRLRKLRASLASAIERARWCSADPLCLESEAAGTDGLNLAACHSCMLLPETSCELNNTFLDRALVIGSSDEGVRGYFE